MSPLIVVSHKGDALGSHEQTDQAACRAYLCQVLCSLQPLWWGTVMRWLISLVVSYDPELSCNLIQSLAGCWRQQNSLA